MNSPSRMIVLAGLILAVCISCQNEGRWYPSAEVLVGNYSEYTDAGGGRALAVTVIIHNTSDTSIASSVVTVKAVTDKREYLQTAGFANKIVPGGKVTLTVSIAYLEPDEAVQSDGVSLYDSFFD